MNEQTAARFQAHRRNPSRYGDSGPHAAWYGQQQQCFEHTMQAHDWEDGGLHQLRMDQARYQQRQL